MSVNASKVGAREASKSLQNDVKTTSYAPYSDAQKISVDLQTFVTAKLMNALKIKGSFDCPDHANETFCTCATARDMTEGEQFSAKANFVMTWELRLITEDNCFLFIGDKKSADFFALRMNNLTPAQFATEFLVAKGSIFEFFEAEVSFLRLVQAMLDFWTERFKRWRKEYKSKEEARECYLAVIQERKQNGYGRSLTQFKIEDLGGAVVGPSGRVDTVEIEWGPLGHLRFVQVLPILVHEKINYRVLRYDVCHEECRNEDELHAILTARSEEDWERLNADKAKESAKSKEPQI